MSERNTCSDHADPSDDTRGHIDPCECALYVSDKTDSLIGILDGVCYVNPPKVVVGMDTKSVSQCQQQWSRDLGPDWKQELRQQLPACILKTDKRDKLFLKRDCLKHGDLGKGFVMSAECVRDVQEDLSCLEDHLTSS